MARELEGKVAVVTGAASGIGLATSEAMLAAGSRVVMVDRDEAALKALCKKHRNAVIPLVIDLLDPKDCATLLPRVLDEAGQLDILHANAGTYVGGDLVDADTVAIDRMLNLNVNVVIKNVHDVLPHMIERRTGDIIVTSSLAAHFPTPWEPVYASSKWGINCFVQTVRRQVFKHGIRVGAISPGPVISALLADWPPEKLKEAKKFRKSAGGQRSGGSGGVHAHTATRYDNSRRGNAAHQFRSLGADFCATRRVAGIQGLRDANIGADPQSATLTAAACYVRFTSIVWKNSQNDPSRKSISRAQPHLRG